MLKLLFLIVSIGAGWLVGLHFCTIFKIVGIGLGGLITLGSVVLFGLSGNSKESSYFAFIGIPLIIGIIAGWFAVTPYTVDGITNSISDSFSVEKVKQIEKPVDKNNLAETLKQLEEAGVITINNKKQK